MLKSKKLQEKIFLSLIIKWNEFGIYYRNNILIGIGFYSQNIVDLSIEIWQLKNVEVLNIVECGLKEISEDIRKLGLLKELYIGGNELKNLPNSIKKLKNLEILYILEENLISLPIEIGELTKLKELSISSKNLKELPSNVIKLKSDQCHVYLNGLEV